MSWQFNHNLTSLQDLATYECSSEVCIPSKEDFNIEGVMAIMDSDPDSFLYVDFLGSTYLVYHRKDANSGRALTPQVVHVEGKHFKDIVKRKYWAFSEDYFWDIYEYVRAELDGRED